MLKKCKYCGKLYGDPDSADWIKSPRHWCDEESIYVRCDLCKVDLPKVVVKEFLSGEYLWRVCIHCLKDVNP